LGVAWRFIRTVGKKSVTKKNACQRFVGVTGRQEKENDEEKVPELGKNARPSIFGGR
jgi:hypothetical protein